MVSVEQAQRQGRRLGRGLASGRATAARANPASDIRPISRSIRAPIFFGVDLHYAMGASIISVIATSSGAAASYLRTGLSNLRLGLFLVVATIAGALTGAVLAGVVPTRWLELTLGLALSYSAFTTIRQLEDEVPPGVSADRLAIRFGLEGTYHDLALRREVPYRARRVAGGFVAMYGAGLLSGMLGIGSGAFKVLAMDTSCGCR